MKTRRDQDGMAQLNELAGEGRRMIAAGTVALKVGLVIVVLLVVALIVLALFS